MKSRPAKIVNSLQTLLALVTLPGITGCAHSYFYTPEISGRGAISYKGGIIYSVPPEQPELKLKVMSKGVIATPENAPAEARAKMQPLQKMAVIKIFYVRLPTTNAQPEYVIPAEQHIILRQTDEIQASFARATVEKSTRIELSAKNSKQGIVLFFPLPMSVHDDNELQFFRFKWVVHYGDGKTEEQTLRFDRQDSAPQGSGGGFYQEDEGVFGEWGSGPPGFAPGAAGDLDTGPYWLL